MRSMTRRFATASDGSIGIGLSSRTAAANAAASTEYWSAVGNVSVWVAGATGGSPAAITWIRVGRSDGMLNGMSAAIRPSVP